MIFLDFIKYLEEKLDGFGGYYFILERKSNKNSVQWIIIEKLVENNLQKQNSSSNITISNQIQTVTNQLVKVPNIPQYNLQQTQSQTIRLIYFHLFFY